MAETEKAGASSADLAILTETVTYLQAQVIELQESVLHAHQHEISGGDEYRISVMDSGVRIQRQREINFADGFTVVSNPTQRRIDLTAKPQIVNPPNHEIWLFIQNGWTY